MIGELDPDLVAVLCEPPAATRLLRGVDFETAGNTLAVGGRLVDIRTPTTIYPDVFVPLHGAHQGDNASLALTAVEAFFAAPLAPDVVEEGFATVSMPGRFEVLGYQPLVIVDGAHNPPGADSCAQVFFEDFHPEGRRILDRRHAARADGDARGAAGRRVRRRDRLHGAVAARRAGPATWPGPPSTSAATRCSPPTPCARPARWPCAWPTARTPSWPPARCTSPAQPAPPCVELSP